MMKNLFILLFVQFMFLSCSEEQQSQVQNKQTTVRLSQYQSMRQTVMENRSDILLMVDKAKQPVAKARMSQLMELVIANETQAGYLRAAGQTADYIPKFDNLINHFMEQIAASKSFSPSDSQREVYATFKSMVKRDSAVIAHFLKAFNPRFSPVQEARRQMLIKVLAYDIDEFLIETLIVEKEFDANFNTLIEEWPDHVEGIRNFKPD